MGGASGSVTDLSSPVEGISASFVTVTKMLSKVGEFPGGAAVAGDEVEDANVAPAGKLGADAMETLTFAGPDTPGEVEPPPPLPQAARAAEINRTNNRYAVVRNVPARVFMSHSSMMSVGLDGRFSYRNIIRAAERTPPIFVP
jgi:hypothetical protein